MKRLLLVFLAVILAGAMIFISCGEPTATPTGTTTPTTPTATQSPTATGPQVQTGGTLRCVAGAIPANLGWPPEKAPSDNFYMLPVIERLCSWDEEGNFVPVLAESWDVDTQGLTITWHLKEGIKFHDGTDFDAEALRWNYQLALDYSRLSDGQYVESLEVVSKYVLTMHLTAFNWVMIENYGVLMQPISPTAFQNSGATDEERIAWARTHAVGTGPFTVADFQRDVVIKFVKNPNYWQEGLPYLDAIELWFIPDPMVAAAKIEAGEADIWFAVSQVQNILDLQDKGFQIVWGPGMFVLLAMNSADPESYFAIKEVREAIEYAINRPALADMLGQGLYEPLHQMASSTWPGYVQGYNPRPFDPAKAREKLEEAGLSAGFTMKILGLSTGADAIAAIQSYLGDVGITVEPDIADLGRYFGAAFATGWEDAIFTASGINPSATDLYTHFGPSPVTFRTGNILKSPEYIAACNAALAPQYLNAADAIDKIREAIRQAGEDAMLIPLWRTAECSISWTYVHTDYPTIHGIIWTPVDDWMEAH
jgi:peptide/nickel transport system substrate-binding protein